MVIKEGSNKVCPFTIGGQLWLQKSNEVFLIRESVELIKEIEKLGSILQAAKKINISYQKAWNLIDQANRNARLPLVKRKRGGNAGGGAEVTAEGRKLIEQFDQLQHHFNEFINSNLELFGY